VDALMLRWKEKIKRFHFFHSHTMVFVLIRVGEEQTVVVEDRKAPNQRTCDLAVM